MPRWGWAILLVLAIGGVALSISAWRYSQDSEREANQVHFDRQVSDIEGDLQLRITETQRLLRSAAALFAASDDVTRADWRAFAEGLNLADSFPGLTGIGYAVVVPAAQLQAHIGAVRREGFAAYTVWPPGDRPLYAPVYYREPFNTRNQRVLGFDLLSEPMRRQALEASRDSGAPTLSGALDLLRDLDQKSYRGALLFLPLYRKGQSPDTPAQRRDALSGWIYSPLNLAVLMDALVKRRADDLLVELWDGDKPGTDARLLYESHRSAARAIPHFKPSFEVTHVLEVSGRRWTLHLATLPDFDASQPSSRSELVLTGGLTLTGVLTLLVGTLLNMRGRAVELAGQLSEAYRASETRVRTVLDNAAEGIIAIDGSGHVLTANPAARALLGLGNEAVDGRQLTDLLPIDLQAMRQQLADAPAGGPVRQWRTEITHQAEDRDTSLLVAASEAVLDDGAQSYVLLLSDVSELKRARALADEAGHLNDTILACAPFCVIATDRTGRIRSINPAGERMLGYAPGELIGKDAARTVLLPEELAAHAARLSAETSQPVTPASVLGVRAMRGQSDEMECTYVCKDGSHVPVVLALAPLRDTHGRLGGFLGIAYDITERKRSETYIRHMAHHDELTGLPNRTLLQERAALAIDGVRQTGKRMAVLLLDLDRFKQINDSLGHHAGDVVLCTVAARLKHVVRASDTVARMGGDEFVILLPNIDSAQQAERVAGKLLQAMTETVQAGNHKLTVTPSIGIACYPQDGEDLPTLLRSADVAMYQSKTSGRNGYTLYTPQMHTASAKRLELEGDLRLALERDELSLHYQPLVSLETGEIIGVEALLRWQHETRGFVSPVDFIPIAEDTGLIVGIGEWVLRTACMEMSLLRQRCGQRLKVAVNLSPRQLRANNLSSVITEALGNAGWQAEDLELEITESMVVENPDASIAAMQRLRAMGVGLAIDDFGTGYSSLSYLTRFPVAKLKLDRSFVRGLPHSERDAAIATSVVAMGHGLKLKVLAEGIETAEQMEFLRGLGCEMGQGYFFAKPMPLEALYKHLQQTQPTENESTAA
jgi:diguanylate cyclase (GGDEF)-like protein/PAS domain S-box-containing protein